MANSAGEFQIEKDLVRWPRGRWIAVVLAILVFQGALLFLTPRGVPGARTKYPHEPNLSFVPLSAPSEWLALHDTSLFASASKHGFSGPAWLLETPRVYVPPDALPAPSFLLSSDFSVDPQISAPMFAAFPHARAFPDPSPVPVLVSSPNPRSHLQTEGFDGRQVISLPELPVQYATDVLRPTVVKALVDSDGSIFSSRVVANSGSKIADNSALDLTRKIRFSPVSVNDSLSSGTLTFDWYALDSTTTNAPPPKAVR